MERMCLANKARAGNSDEYFFKNENIIVFLAAYADSSQYIF